MTALRYNEGKTRYDLIPADALEMLAQVYTVGANKYTRTTEVAIEEAAAWLESVLSEILPHPVILIELSTAEKCVGTATKPTCVSETRPTLNDSEQIGETGQAETPGSLRNLPPPDGATLVVDSETPPRNGVGDCGGLGSMRTVIASSRYYKTDAAGSATGSFLTSRQFTLTIVMSKGGREESFAVDATTASGCFSKMWSCLSEQYPTYKIHLQHRFSPASSGITITTPGDHNWEKGFPWVSCYASLMRHIQAWARGEDLDVGPNGEFGPYPDQPEIDMRWTGLPHMALASWNSIALTTFFLRGVGTDDRIKPKVASTPER